MSVCPIADLDFEAVFKDIRSYLLNSISEIRYSSDLLNFQSALAQQCFINEYVYFESEEETKLVNELETVIAANIMRSKQPDVFKIRHS